MQDKASYVNIFGRLSVDKQFLEKVLTSCL